MKISLKELRKFIGKYVAEAPSLPTISADLDPQEAELNKKIPQWANQKTIEFKTDSPGAVKQKQAKEILKNLGYTRDSRNQKAITMWLGRFINTMYEPEELFDVDSRDIAKDFAKKFLTH